MAKLLNFIKETRAELKHVNWPSRKETTRMTILVIVLSIATAYLLGLFDLIFNWMLERFIL